MKKVTILLLSFMFIFSSVSFSVAEESQREISGNLIEERFIGLSRASTSLNISTNTAKCKATAYASSSEYYLYVTLSLQKKNGNTWNTIASWNGSGSGITGVILSKTKSGLVSGTYRCKAYVRVYDSDSAFIESTIIYSQLYTV